MCDLEKHVGFINHCLLLLVPRASLLLLGKFSISCEATACSSCWASVLLVICVLGRQGR